MRSALALGLLIVFCGSADAARGHHPKARHVKARHVIVRPSQPAPEPYRFPGWPAIPPEQNRNLDPSNRGSA
jgi:hypothetical protein